MRLAHGFPRDSSSATWSSTCTAIAAAGTTKGDEPAFTQPVLYRAIERTQDRVRDGYLDHLLQLGEITREEADQIAAERREHLEQELVAASQPRLRAAGESAQRRVDRLRRRPRDGRGRRRHRRDAATRCRSLLDDANEAAGRLSSASEDRARARTAPRDGARRAAARLGGGRSRWPSPRWPSQGMPRPLDGPGQRARHVQPAARRAARRTGRPSRTCRCATLPTEQAPVEIYNSPLVRSRRAGIRVRLQPRLPRRRW